MKGELILIGAIVGDVVGSRFEWHNIKTKEFSLFHRKCFATDDSIMTLAIAKALLTCKEDYSDLSEKTIECMQEVGRPYPTCGYGGHFMQWMYTDNPKPYNSYGNGSAMRVSACGWVAKSLKEAEELARIVSAVSHNHPEGIKGAQVVAGAVFLARKGESMAKIQKYVDTYYQMDYTLDDIRPTYTFDVTCQGSVPQALLAFLESESFEDAIRNAISIGGDSDTIAAITGSIAEAYYGVPKIIRNIAIAYLDERLKPILREFEEKYGIRNLR